MYTCTGGSPQFKDFLKSSASLFSSSRLWKEELGLYRTEKQDSTSVSLLLENLIFKSHSTFSKF